MAAARKQGVTAPAAPAVEEAGVADAAPVTPAEGDTTAPAPADDTTAPAPADAATEPAPADAVPDVEDAEPKGFIVSGAAVVLRTEDGRERYLYRNARFPDGVFSDASVEHSIASGLVKAAE